MHWQSISTAPKDRIILTNDGTARYIDKNYGFHAPAEGWYLCSPSGFIPCCDNEGMEISRIYPQTWLDIELPANEG